MFPAHRGKNLTPARGVDAGTIRRAPEIIERQPDAIVGQVVKAHAKQHAVERRELGMVVTAAVQGHQGEIPAQRLEDGGAMSMEKHLPAAALPFEVPGEVDVADQVGFRETDRVKHFEGRRIGRGRIHIDMSAAMAMAT